MTNPTIDQVRAHGKIHSVQCPLNASHYIPRDATSYKEHMIREHSANDNTSWTSPSAPLRAQGGGPKDDGKGTKVYPDWPCYGCGSTFITKADLVAHLSAVHGAE